MLQTMNRDIEIVRAFVCVDFPLEVIEEVARVQEILGKWEFTGKFTELENLHMTLKFLGEISFDRLEKVREKLNEIKIEKFEARLDKLGIFNFKGNPRIVWIKLGGKGIFELQEKVDFLLGDLGFEREKRFMSHMTIARVKYVKDKKGFKKFVEGIGLKDVRFKVGGFKLKSSELRAVGPIYGGVESYALRSSS